MHFFTPFSPPYRPDSRLHQPSTPQLLPHGHPTYANDRLDMEIYFGPTRNVNRNAVHDLCTHISNITYPPDKT